MLGSIAGVSVRRQRRPRVPERGAGDSRCRCRPGRLPVPPVSADDPGSGLRRADLRCTSAARGATDARRSCGRRRSSPGCTSRRPAFSRILICLATRLMLICSTSRSMILIRSSSVSEVKRITSSRRLRNSGLNAFSLRRAPCLRPCRERLPDAAPRSPGGRASRGSARPGSTS